MLMQHWPGTSLQACRLGRATAFRHLSPAPSTPLLLVAARPLPRHPPSRQGGRTAVTAWLPWCEAYMHRRQRLRLTLGSNPAAMLTLFFCAGRLASSRPALPPRRPPRRRPVPALPHPRPHRRLPGADWPLCMASACLAACVCLACPFRLRTTHCCSATAVQPQPPAAQPWPLPAAPVSCASSHDRQSSSTSCRQGTGAVDFGVPTLPPSPWLQALPSAAQSSAARCVDVLPVLAASWQAKPCPPPSPPSNPPHRATPFACGRVANRSRFVP